jgi:hypothetical protein
MSIRALLLVVLSFAFAVLRVPAGSPPGAGAGLPPALWEARLAPIEEGQDWSAGGAERYTAAVEELFQAFEAKVGRRLSPGEKGKVGLKIYAESGAGLATPKGLVRAAIEALVRRGYARENIFLVGLNQLRLRLTGYLPNDPRIAPPFEGHPFFVLESGRYYDPTWFYDSPLPSRFDPILSGRQDGAPDLDLDRLAVLSPDPTSRLDPEADRKSFLATPLFLEADFWINLPVYTDHEALGVNGALANATLWNASNTSRFFRSTRSAPAAVAEMAAIPELRQTWAFTLASIERWQFVGGPDFNSLYTRGEARLWLGTDPVWMDALMLRRINEARRAAGFRVVSEDIRTLEFAERLDVGRRDRGEPTPVHVPEGP